MLLRMTSPTAAERRGARKQSPGRDRDQSARKMLWINAGTDDDCVVVEGRANNRRVWIVRNLP